MLLTTDRWRIRAYRGTGFQPVGSVPAGSDVSERQHAREPYLPSSFPDLPPLVPTVASEHQDLFIDSSEAGRGHRLNILDDDFAEVGVGVATGVFQGYQSVMVTQDFASTANAHFLTGVAYSDARQHDN